MVVHLPGAELCSAPSTPYASTALRRVWHIAFALILVLLIAPSFLPSTAWAQSAGDFRSQRSGRWDRTNTWQEFNGASWGNANNIPDWRDGTVTIRTEDLVTASSRLSARRDSRFRVIVEDPDRALEEWNNGITAAIEPVLAQNYPNPFNPVTTIRFSLPESAPVRLEVFNLLGQHVQTLVNGTLPAGWNEARFDGTSLASGTYVYRLTIAGQSFTRPMLLLR